MPICVRSEIGPLKTILLQRPGRELERLSPGSLERLLFDDIPYLYGAQKEHDQFAAMLREHGVQVLYLDDLTAQVLSQKEELKKHFVQDAIRLAGGLAVHYRHELTEYLMGIREPRELVRKTMEGVSLDELLPHKKPRLADYIQPGSRFVMDPVPNLYFTRDPFACIGRGVSLNHMSTLTRSRETLYGRCILEHHPDYAGTVPFYYTPEEEMSIEGGDILNLNEKTVAVGISQRTQPEAAERLAQHLFRDREGEVETVLAFYIPHARAFMHLDTVFTQVDRNVFTVHPGILGSLRIFALTGRGKRALRTQELSGTLEHILEDQLRLDAVTLIRCGGEDRIAAEREQWNDGANTLCIRPGTVVVYDRNYVTNEILEAAGIEVLRLAGSELSRGRGGPRCMSMPLWREDV